VALEVLKTIRTRQTDRVLTARKKEKRSNQLRTMNSTLQNMTRARKLGYSLKSLKSKERSQMEPEGKATREENLSGSDQYKLSETDWPLPFQETASNVREKRGRGTQRIRNLFDSKGKLEHREKEKN